MEFMDKGRFIYIGSFKLPDLNASAHKVVTMSKAFRELGYNVTFLEIRKSAKDIPGDVDNGKLIKEQDIWDFERWSICYTNKEFALKVKDIIQLAKHYGDVKGVIAYDYPGFAIYKLMAYGKKHGIKIISDCTEWYEAPVHSFLFYIAKKVDVAFRMVYVNKRVDGLIVISKFLSDYYSGCDHVVELPPLVDKTDEKWNQKIEKNPGKIVFVYAGDMGNKDYMPAVIDGLYQFKDYENFQLRIYGIHYEDYTARFESQKQKLKELGDKVRFFGYIPHNQCIKEVSSADFIIFLRKNCRLNQAGFPTKFVEAISCKTPVITSDTSNIVDYCRDNPGVLVLKEPFEDNLKCLFEKILVQGRYRDDSVRNAIDENLFDYRNYITKIDEFLKGVL